jgi:hypothetical protein
VTCEQAGEFAVHLRNPGERGCFMFQLTAGCITLGP